MNVVSFQLNLKLESTRSSDNKRLLTGILIGFLLLILTGGAYSLEFFMISILVFGCTHHLPDWLYLIAFVGSPIPMIITTIVVPYLYIKKQKVIWMIITSIAGVFLSSLIFLIWFLILTQYC